MRIEKKSLIDTILPWIYVRKDPFNTPEEFWGLWRRKLDVMYIEMHLQLPKNNWKDVKAYKYFQKRKIHLTESIPPRM